MEHILLNVHSAYNERRKTYGIPTTSFNEFQCMCAAGAFRFPPEPNGYLHTGHTKAATLNYLLAKETGATFYLRLDDTNPTKESINYVTNIINDLQWLNIIPDKITYTSDYFEQLLTYANELICKNKAYICECSQEQMHELRSDHKNTEGIVIGGLECDCRVRQVEESMNLFIRMREGEFEEGQYTLRLKIDMHHQNPNMRDPVAYRIIASSHHRTGMKYCIYPSYDYSHPICDMLENIVTSLCTMEFQSRNILYHWVLSAIDATHIPHQIEYSRLNLSHTVLSKRKLIRLVEESIVDGWTDPRMPTVAAMRRRGFTPNAIRNFVLKLGISIGNSDGIVSYKVLESCVRDDLNQEAERAMAIFDPYKVVIANPDMLPTVANAKLYPQQDNSPTYDVGVDRVLWISHADFLSNANKKYKRLSEGRTVRLKYLGLIQYISHTDDYVEVKFIPEIMYDKTIHGKIHGTITWVGKDAIPAIVKKYTHLFPESVTDGEWFEQLCIDSCVTESALVSRAFKCAQIERYGYWYMDEILSNSDHLVFHETVSLKEAKW